ncbi:MAG: hypothetical protein ACM34E_01885 [Acidobacteriota bacterium]
MALTPGAYSQFGQDTDNTMEFCLHEVGHFGNDEKIGAPPVRLDRDNGNVVGLAIAYTIANADRELPGTVTKFL